MTEVPPVLLTNRMPEIEREVHRLDDNERQRLSQSLLAVIQQEKRSLLARISAGNALGLLGDPRIDPLHPAMCGLPPGPFWMGTKESEVEEIARRYGIPHAWMAKSTPRHRVELDAFEIARLPVTEREYELFIEDTGIEEIPAHWLVSVLTTVMVFITHPW